MKKILILLTLVFVIQINTASQVLAQEEKDKPRESDYVNLIKDSFKKAAKNGNAKSIKSLLQKKSAIIDQQVKVDALQLAAQHNNKDIMMLLLSSATLKERDILKFWALRLAVEYDYENILTSLLRLYSSTNTAEQNLDLKMSALELAAKFGNENIIKLLISDSSQLFQQKALEFAAIEGYTNIIKIQFKHNKINSDMQNSTLALAISNNHENIVKLLLSLGNINKQNQEAALKFINKHDIHEKKIPGKSKEINKKEKNDIRRLFKEGARYGNAKTIQLVLDNNSDAINLETKEEALKIAAEYNHQNIIHLLLDSSTGKELDKLKYFTLNFAAKHDYENIIQTLLKNDQDFQEKALRSAASKGNENIVQILLNYSNINENDKLNALKIAASKGYTNIIRILLFENDHSFQKKALEFAAKNGYAEIIYIQLEYGDINSFMKDHALKTANANNHKNIVKLLHDVNNKEINPKNFIKYNFKKAAQHGNEAKVKFMLQRDDIIINTETKKDALQIAAEHNHKNIIYLLLNFATDKELYTLKYWSLNLAAKYGYEDVVKNLLKLNIDPDVQGASLEVAISNGHENIVKLLLDSGNISQKDKILALAVAASYGYKNIVKLLLDSGNIDKKGKLHALKVATLRHHKNVVKLLEDSINSTE